MTLEEILRELATQVPSLGVLTWLVWKGLSTAQSQAAAFLEHLKGRDESFSGVLKEIGKDCHEHSSDLTERYRAAMERQTQISERVGEKLDKNTEMLGRVASALARRESA